MTKSKSFWAGKLKQYSDPKKDNNFQKYVFIFITTDSLIGRLKNI